VGALIAGRNQINPLGEFTPFLGLESENTFLSNGKRLAGGGCVCAVRDGPELSTFVRELDSPQMQCLRFVGADDRHYLDLHHVALPRNGEAPPRYI
jgi:hypothetical protein